MAGKVTTLDDCWNLIGTWSEQGPSCERLATVMHCLNCEVYAQVGRELLNRRPPDEYLVDWKKFLAEPLRPLERKLKSVLVFRIGANWFGISTMLLEGVIDPPRVHSLPHNASPAILGVVGVRGELYMCVSLSGMLRASKELVVDTEFPSRHVIIGAEELYWTLPVDEVHGIHRLKPGAYDAPGRPPEEFDRALIDGVFAWQDKQVMVLGDQSLLERLNQLRP